MSLKATDGVAKEAYKKDMLIADIIFKVIQTIALSSAFIFWLYLIWRN